MDIRHLTHIVTLAELRNFARAAERLHLSQPALTRSIQAAEAALGLRLFDRGNGAVTPTPAGEFVLARARPLVFDSRCLLRDVDLYRDRQLGDTAFGVGPFAAVTFLTGLLVGLRQAHPAVHLRIEVGHATLLLDHLRQEDIEFFVADQRDLPPDPDLAVRALRQEPGGFYVRAGHPLASHADLRLADLWAQGVASVRLPAAVRVALAGWLGLPAGAALPIAVECDDVETLRRVALATDTVLAITQAAVADDVARGALLPLPVSGMPTLQAQMAVVTLRGRTPSPMADLILQRLADLPADPAAPAGA